MFQPSTLFSNLNIRSNPNLKSHNIRTSQTVSPEGNICNRELIIGSANMYYFPSSLSGYRQLQRHRCRLGSAIRCSELRNCCAEHTYNGSAYSGADRFPRGAGRSQTGGFPHHRPQLGWTCRWFRWQKHHHGKSGQDYRSVLLCRGDFLRSRSIVSRVKSILPNRCLLIIHHHLPNSFVTK